MTIILFGGQNYKKFWINKPVGIKFLGKESTTSGKVVKLSQLSESTFSVRIDTTQLRSYAVTFGVFAL